MSTVSADVDLNLLSDTFVCKPPNPRSEKEIMSLWGDSYEQPLVSILCITYQHKDFIKDALNSFLMQETSFPFEIVVRDDASIDGTREIVDSYSKKYPNIIKAFLESENQFSKGVKPLASIILLAKGEYIAICDGDDYWCDDSKLEKQVRILSAQPECVVTYHDAIHLSTAGSKTPIFRLNDSGRRGYSRQQLLQYSYMPTQTLCFKNVIHKMPEESRNVKNADTFLISLLGQYGYAVYVPDIKPAMYREHEGGIWSGLSNEDKRISTITTCYWLSIYYRRQSNHSMSNYYAYSAMNHMLSEVKVNKLSFLKWFIVKYFHRSHAIYFALKTKCQSVIAMFFKARN